MQRTQTQLTQLASATDSNAPHSNATTNAGFKSKPLSKQDNNSNNNNDDDDDE